MAFTGNVANHLAPGIRAIVGTQLRGGESWYSRMYNVGTSERKYEDWLYATALPIAVEKPEGQDIQAFDPIEGSTKRVQQKVYAIALEVSFEAWEDDLYAGNGSALRAAAEGLADSLRERVEVETHRPFIEGFSGTTWSVLPGGEPFFSASHAPVAGGQGPSQANRPSTDVDLNVTSFRAALTTMRKYKNDQGLRIPGYTRPQRLWVSPDGEFDALEIIRSSNRPDTANRVENVTQNIVEVVVDPYLSDDPDAWFVQASRFHTEFLWRKRPTLDSFDDRRARVSIHVGLERFSFYPVSWYGWYGSPGA